MIQTIIVEQQVELGQIPARQWLSTANQVLKLTTNQRAVTGQIKTGHLRALQNRPV